MSEIPRPLTLGEILDRTVQIYRSRFLVLFGISVIPTGGVLVIASAAFLVLIWSGRESASGTRGIIAVTLIVIASLIAVPVILAATALAEAAVNDAANRAHFGERVTIRTSYAAIWNRGWHYIWLLTLRGLAIWGVPFAVFFGVTMLAGVIAAVGGAGQAGGALFGLLIVLIAVALAAYAILMAMRLSLAFPACVVEQSSAWTAVKRSNKLSNGTRGRIFVLYLLGGTLLYILTFGIMIAIIFGVMLIPSMRNTQHAQMLGRIMVFAYYGTAFAVQALIKPVYGIALILFYYDQRIRQEGFDIEWMMYRAGLVAPVLEKAAAAPVQMADAEAGPAAEVALARSVDQAEDTSANVAVGEVVSVPAETPQDESSAQDQLASAASPTSPVIEEPQ